MSAPTMKERTWRGGARFYKRVNGPAEARCLIGRAHQITEAGALTPEPEYCPDRNVLTFPVIDGPSGTTLIDAVALSELLAPLQVVRRANMPDLPVFDPFAKIAARLKPDAPHWLIDRVARLQGVDAGPAGIVHGDFHCGQLIRDCGGRVWIIDLEDMSQGPVEADLGNFAAHLATHPETGWRDLAEGVQFWAGRVQDAWNRLGKPCDAALFRRHVDVALTRRALKLRHDRAEPEVLAALKSLPVIS
ncbi:phosphotransferase [Pelagibius litoralis]|uniref:Phosphotransferase n=1 Tax=Pelagibius litoralis TaxID=374515 RepID=A0A967EYB4_9PROT|nr:phosphotransferase [Pelagibius litoralis]NIA69671.1 phosphotransferase [Pelagibius litoralis]